MGGAGAGRLRRAAHDARRVRVVALHPGARRRRLRRRRRQVVAAGRGARLRRRPGHAATRPHVELRVGGTTGGVRRGLRRHRHAAGRGGDPRLRAARAHEQVFQARGARRVDVNSQEAAVTIRSALQTINPRWPRSSPPTCSTRPRRSHSPTPSTCCSARRAGSRTSTSRCFLVGVAVLFLAMVVRARACAGDPHRRRHARGRGRPPARRRLRHSGLLERRRHQRSAAGRGGRRVHRRAGRPADRRRSGVLRVRPRPRVGTRPRRRRPPPPRRADAGVVGREAHPAAWRFAGGVALMVARAGHAHDPRRRVPRPARGGGRARALRGHRGLPARRRPARHRPHHPAFHKRQVFGVFAARRRRGVVHRVRRRRDRRQQHDPAAREPQQPGVQRLHRAVPAAAQPDRVAGEPQRDGVGGVRLPRRRADR